MANLAAAAPGYRSYFGWTFLFRVGAPNITMSTGLVGVFLLPVAVLFPVGLIALATRRDPIPSWPIIAGLVFAPMPAAMSGHAEAIQRALLMLPMASLVVGAGFGALWRSKVPWFRAGAIVVVAAVPLQLKPFIEDYFTLHRQRSEFYFDSVAFDGVAAHITQIDRVPAVFLRRNLDSGGARWRFHLTKAGRQDLLARTFFFSDIGEAGVAPADSILVMYVENTVIAQLTADGAWEVEAIVRDVDDREAAAILRKLR